MFVTLYISAPQHCMLLAVRACTRIHLPVILYCRTSSAMSGGTLGHLPLRDAAVASFLGNSQEVRVWGGAGVWSGAME